MEITEDMIYDCVKDTSINGKYSKLYQMIVSEVEHQISVKRMGEMINVLNYVGINCNKMNKAEVLFEYSKLI